MHHGEEGPPRSACRAVTWAAEGVAPAGTRACRRVCEGRVGRGSNLIKSSNVRKKEHWVVYATNESLDMTTKTYDVLYVG